MSPPDATDPHSEGDREAAALVEVAAEPELVRPAIQPSVGVRRRRFDAVPGGADGHSL